MYNLICGSRDYGSYLLVLGRLFFLLCCGTRLGYNKHPNLQQIRNSPNMMWGSAHIDETPEIVYSGIQVGHPEPDTLLHGAADCHRQVR